MKYQLLPRLSAEEYAALERSIIAHGVLVPVEYDEAGEIIDGHHRVEICESLGLVDWPRFVRKGLSEVEKRTLSREFNFARRHLTTAQKQAVIADQLRDTPSISSRAIASMLGVHHTTVQSVRKQLVDGGEISHHDEVEGKDGVRQPAHKPIKTAFVPDQPNVGEYMKGAKIIRAEKQKLSHTVRLAHMDLIAERGRESAPASLSRIYPVYYGDPCWQYAVRSEVTGREKSAENHYPTMPTDEICALLASLIGGEHPAVCFLWATNPMLLDGLRVLDACGFTYVHHWVWDKEVAGTGYWGRDRHEILLIGRRGDIAAPLPGTQPETVYRERKGRHSAKPDYFAEQIEKLFPGVAKLELFARAARPGWDAWGYEAGEATESVISPPEGEMAGRPEGGAVPPAFAVDPKLLETVIKGVQTETGRKALVKALDVLIEAEESARSAMTRLRVSVCVRLLPERCQPGVAKLEMFCRAPRPGWDHWGFEVGDVPETASEKVGGVASACSALVTRRELDVNASENGVTAGETGSDTCERAAAESGATAGETAPISKRGRPRKAVPA